MKKNIFLFASLLASLFIAGSCQKYDVKESAEDNAKLTTVTVEAKLGAATGEGMKTAIAADDVLRIRFYDGEGNGVGRTQMLANTTGEGATATFSAKVAVPNNASAVIAYLDNRTSGKINYGSAPTKAAFSKQDGSLSNAQALQIITGATDYSSKMSIDLNYATTIVKADLTFPEGVSPIVGETTITLAVNEYSDVTIGDDIEGERNNITVKANVDAAKKSATAYIALLAEDEELKKGTIFSEFGGVKFGCDVNGKDIESGKTFSVKEETIVLVYSYFIPDEEYVIDNVTGNKVSGDSFITVSGGKITVAENTTGKIRNGSVLLDNGKEYKFTQIGVNEFKGSWTMKAKSFSNNTSLITASNNKAVSVTFGDPVGGVETLEDFDGTKHVNNIGIKGLYGTAVMNAALEIDYKTKEVKFGIFCDARKAQAVTVSNIANYNYVCFLPEMGTSTAANSWNAPWNFVQADLDTEKDYCWIWFKVNADLDEFTWYSFADRQFMTGNLATAANCIIGITCAVCKSEVASKSNVYGTYNVIYQANSNSDKVVPMSFTKN